MYKTENLAVNGGNITLGLAKTFDLKIPSRWCKIVAIKIVQLAPGPMDIMFEVWESTATQVAPGVRTNLYQMALLRNIVMGAALGSQYGESLTDAPMPYFDRDAVDEESTYMIHCRLENNAGGTASDFAVSLTVADAGEAV